MSRCHLRLPLSLLLSIAVATTSAVAGRATYPEAYSHAPAESARRAAGIERMVRDAEPLQNRPALTAASCVGGDAGGYACSNVDLVAYMPAASIGGGTGNDVWGWTDPLSGVEYALMGLSTGTAFIDLRDPENPVYLGLLPTHTTDSLWRGIKAYRDHAFIVSEASGHGMQVFDLTQLRSVTAPPVTFAETAFYGDMSNSHTIAIDEASGFAFAAGTNTCSGGLHIIDIRTPDAPVFAGCFATDGYTHEPQCVSYAGPDPDWIGKEICLAFNEDTLTVVDVTNKSATAQISRTGYVNNGYAHQGWFSEDRRWVFMNDELDELRSGINTRTIVWDTTDLDAPVYAFSYIQRTIPAIDHNLYVKGTHIFESNYRSGLRILDTSCIDGGNLVEVGFFDMYPGSDSPNFNGTWSNYPFFKSGIVLVTGIEAGMFIVRPNLITAPPAPTGVTAIDTGSNRIDLDWPDLPGVASYAIQRSVNGCAGPFVDLATTTASAYSDLAVSAPITYGYIVQAGDPLGCPAVCVETKATGNCTLPPGFAGASLVANTFGVDCGLEVRWPAATGVCSSDLVYNVYRGTVAGFTPSASNRVASCVTGGSWIDTVVTAGSRYFYVVRAEDRAAVGVGVCGGVEEGNGVERVGRPVSDSVLTEFVDGAETTPSMILEIPWLVSTADSQAGAASFRVSAADPLMCTALITPLFVPTLGSVLSYGHREQDLEGTYDGGTVEISNDGGSNWSKVDPTPAYPDVFFGPSRSCNNVPAATGAYTGDSGRFRAATVALAPWAGQEIAARFRLGTDGGFSSTAWWIDEVHVTDLAVGSCGLLAWNLYRSTVTSVATGWKGLVPLPLLPTSNIDPGWPRRVTAPSSETDIGALLGTDPLALYRLLDDAGNPVGNQLRMVKAGPSDVSISF